MKSIINGRRFDTDAPQTQEIADYSTGSSRDHGHIRETLYRTGHGNWFLAGVGGPASRYSERVDNNSWSGGSKIIPLDNQEALDWLEARGETDVIEKWFAASVQDA